MDKSANNNTTSSSIANLKARVVERKGYAKSNRFVVDFSATSTLFESVVPINNSHLDDFNYFCETCSLPGRTTNTTDYSSWRQDIKIPIGYTNDDVEMTFNMTNDFYIKRLLDMWAGRVINYNTYLLNYDDYYRRDIKIYQLDEYNKPTYGVLLIGAFPYSIKAIELNNGDSDTISKCSASFAYKEFAHLDITNPLTMTFANPDNIQ